MNFIYLRFRDDSIIGGFKSVGINLDAITLIKADPSDVKKRTIIYFIGGDHTTVNIPFEEVESKIKETINTKVGVWC